MRGAVFRWVKVPKKDIYSEPRETCEFCNVEFKNTKAAGYLREGYMLIGGVEWICRACFGLYQSRFGWSEE